MEYLQDGVLGRKFHYTKKRWVGDHMIQSLNSRKKHVQFHHNVYIHIIVLHDKQTYRGLTASKEEFRFVCP